jgi:hypothetical protein
VTLDSAGHSWPGPVLLLFSPIQRDACTGFSGAPRIGKPRTDSGTNLQRSHAGGPSENCSAVSNCGSPNRLSPQFRSGFRLPSLWTSLSSALHRVNCRCSMRAAIHARVSIYDNSHLQSVGYETEENTSVRVGSCAAAITADLLVSHCDPYARKVKVRTAARSKRVRPPAQLCAESRN